MLWEKILDMTSEKRASNSDEKIFTVFILVDGALLKSLPDITKRKWITQTATSLFPLGTDEDTTSSGPLLFSAQGKTVKTISELCAKQKYSNIASVIVSKVQDIRELAAGLRPFMDITLSDNSEMIMRFFDPRILPFWFKLLSPVHRNLLAVYIQNWSYWDCEYTIQNEEFATGQDAGNLNATFPIRLTSEQENQLLDASYPYTIIERFKSEAFAKLKQIKPEEAYLFYKNQIAKAAKYGITDGGALESYCELAMEYGINFDEHEFLQPLWKLVRSGEPLHKALALIPAEGWSKINDPSHQLKAA